ncbi:DUF1080 domain-containing protein [Croceivirga sp. JEA036]|uniref:3-keto-disaccharide hydrolase n=1 Tax=Croceivirga sp. JEA036 TaxID=2721162 RepID=UPI00143AF948|nr:DUF1080 domain-containing protein [Croceivirga sp. JEA036]NJB36061.1 DUF1080 domain-containing protein [Croceivirga sp. JEA036]
MKPLKLIKLLLLLLTTTLFAQQKPNWQPLLQGESFKGWTIKNGTATYTLENGVVTGTTKLGTPNTFLCTDKMYTDFILEFEVWVDPTVNSGVQFRSNSFVAVHNGKVHGYQSEIDPSERAWSGGIFEEGLRGWLYNLENNPVGRKAFKNNQWNNYRVQANGNHLSIWVNGINTANLKDNATAEGFIGLQVHSIGNESQENKKIKWRNIKILTKDLKEHLITPTAPLIDLTHKKRST